MCAPVRAVSQLLLALSVSLAVAGPTTAVPDSLGSAPERPHPPPDAEGAFGVAVAPDGSIWVVGQTKSADFPTRRAWQPAAAGGLDAFVVRLRPGGRGVLFATYLGGSEDDRAYSVAVDGNGYGYVSGTTRSAGFPVQRALQDRSGGGADAFLVKLAPDGDVVYSTFFGGSRDEGMAFVTVDSRGRPSIVGVTRSEDLPTVNADQAQPGGGGDAFVARLAPSGRQLQYSTYLGGPGFEAGLAIVAAPDGTVHIAGRTSSTALRGESGVGGEGRREAGDRAAADREAVDEEAADAFVTTIARNGRVRWTRRLAGSGGDLATSIARGPNGELWAMGRTTSADFPMVDPIQSEFGGHYDVWVARLGAAGKLQRSTYLGGEDIDFGLTLGDAIVIDEAGRVTMIGKTDGPDFPAVRALQPDNAGGYDAWVGRIDPEANRLMFATFLGGEGHEFGLAAALDARGHAWIVGKTGSRDFPTRNPLQAALVGGYDVWIARLARGGHRLAFSTYLGGSR